VDRQAFGRRGRGLFEGAVCAFAWTDWGILQKDRIAGQPVYFRIRGFSKRTLELFRYVGWVGNRNLCQAAFRFISLFQLLAIVL
jgi:hypothetical protein